MAFSEDKGLYLAAKWNPWEASEHGMLSPTPAPCRLWTPAWRPGSGMRGRAVGGDGSELVGGVPVLRGFWSLSSVCGPGQFWPVYPPHFEPQLGQGLVLKVHASRPQLFQ